MEKTLDFSALSALNLPEIQVENDGSTTIVKDDILIQPKKPGERPAPIKAEDLEEDFTIGEVESIDDVIDISELSKNKDKFKPVKEVKSDEDDLNSNIDDDPIIHTNNEEQEDPYSAYALWLKENSIMDYDEEEFRKAEDKNEFLVRKEIEKFESAVEEYKASHSPYIKQLIEYDDEGLDLGKILTHDARIQSYDKLSIEKIKEDEGLQKTIVSDYLRRQGESESEIRETIEELTDNLTLDKKAEKYFPKLRDAEIKEKNAYIKEQENQRKAQEKAYNDSIKETKQYIDKLDAILPNVPLTKAEKQQVFENLTKADPRSGLTGLQKAAQKDPMKFNALMSYLALKNFDFEDLVKATKTAVAKDVKSKLSSTKIISPDTKINLSIFKKALGK